ncbi:MCFD2 (predicted) [Pycnogonum litorale]
MIEQRTIWILLLLTSLVSCHQVNIDDIKIKDGMGNIIKVLSEKEHIKDEYADEFGMDFEELEDKKEPSKDSHIWHFFNLHDHDRNGYLDGNELFKSMIHQHQGEQLEATSMATRMLTAENIVDQMIKERDLDGDGFINIAEFQHQT